MGYYISILKKVIGPVLKWQFIWGMWLLSADHNIIPSHTHSHQTYSWRPSLIILWNRVSNHNEYSHAITNRRFSFQCMEGASGFFTMPIHIATQSGNQAWTLNEYQSFISLGIVGTTMDIISLTCFLVHIHVIKSKIILTVDYVFTC